MSAKGEAHQSRGKPLMAGERAADTGATTWPLTDAKETSVEASLGDSVVANLGGGLRCEPVDQSKAADEKGDGDEQESAC